MAAERRRTRDLIVVAIFVFLLAFLFWPSGGDEQESDAAPDGVAEMETPDPESTETPVAQRELACEPEDAARVLNAWIGAVNGGNQDRLREMLPPSGAATPTSTSYPGMDQSILHSFTVHESGAMTSPDDVLEYLHVRYEEHNEHWRIDDVELQRLGRSLNAEGNELDRATVRFQRSADDLPDHEVHGTIVLNCYERQILLVDLFTDEPDLALPIPVEDFLGAVGPYGTGEMRDLRMIVSTDLREDTGALTQWDIRRIEANSMAGNYVESVQVHTMNGNEILTYIYDGSRWYLNHRGWREMGDLTGWTVLPLEIMLTRNEPSITANILRDHIDEIPAEGAVTFTGEFEVRDELRRAASMVPRAEAVDGVVEVEVQDGNLVRTSYRIVDRQLGVHSNVPQIQWLHIHRRDRYEPRYFARPSGFMPDEQQFVPSDDLEERMELVERLDHMDGIGERFELEWDGEVHDLLIIPSRGFSHENSRGDDWPLTWEREQMLVGGHVVILSGPDYETFPEAVLWDTRQFRYELRVDRDSFDDPDQWDLDTVRAIVEALLMSEDTGEGWRWIGP